MEWYFINPRAGLSVEVNPNSIIFYSIGSTGREPTRNDLFGGNDNLLADSFGNPIKSILTPEYVLNHELGFRHQSQNIAFNMNLYYMDFKNEIVLDGKYGPNGLALTNKVERSIRTGIELSVSYKVSNSLTLINNSSFNYSRIKQNKIVFTPILSPPIIVNQEAVYSYKGSSIAVVARYQDKSFIDFANTCIVKSYFLFNVRIEYNINGFHLCMFLNNITNSKYFNNGYVDIDGSRKYFVQTPANINISIIYSL
jgi:iron complex outermembrane receptor protein